MITNVKGSFKEFSGEVLTAGDDFSTAEIRFSMNPASVTTGDDQRDGHLKSPDFFDVEKYPEAGFRATSFVRASGDDFKMTGDLTLRGVTKPVTLDVTFEGMMKDPWGNQKAGFSITGVLSRKEWDLTWNAALEAGGMLVSDEVRIACDVQLLKK